MDSITDAFQSLLAEADSLLQQDPFAEQVIVVETAKETRYHCVNHEIMDGETAEEDAFIETLQDSGDTTVCYLVAVWNCSTVNCLPSDLLPVDLPSFHLRQKLLTLSPENANTRILLWGNDGYGHKILGATMPSSQTP